MKNEILSSMNDPAQLEKLYRADKAAFRRTLQSLYPEQKDNLLIRFWHERLNFGSEEVSWGSSKDLWFVLIASLTAGTIAKLPDLFNWDPEFFYPRNIGFIVFPMLMAFFAWKNELPKPKIAILAGAGLLALLFINTVPFAKDGDTFVLSCIHLLLFLWCLLGFSFVGEWGTGQGKRLEFLKFNGDLIVITALILIAGGITSGLTVGLFSLIGLNIENFYFRNIVVFALPAVPIIGTYLTRTNPQLVGKVSPVIARIFCPVVLVTLVVYLGAIMFSAKDPFHDREFLLVFNALLIGVMALIFFSVAETSRSAKSKAELWVLFLLSAVTIIVNGIALWAILFRISEWGLTPNRAAVLGSNVLILVNLLLVSAQLFGVVSRNTSAQRVGNTIAAYLPVYFVWTIIVTFVFPLIFGFR